jgi:hypothetical protein
MDTTEAPPPDRMLLITGHIGVRDLIHEILAVYRNGAWAGAHGEIISDVSSLRELPG